LFLFQIYGGLRGIKGKLNFKEEKARGDREEGTTEFELIFLPGTKQF